jgi:hypothetical protein
LWEAHDAQTIAAAAGAAALSVAALAAAHIPTRYSGSFPSVGSFTGVTGTFTGRRLALRYTFVGNGGVNPSTAKLSCAAASPAQSRCAGRFQSDDGRFSGRLDATISWSNGRPVAIDIEKS